ncbi:hypothetical protein MPHLEI_15026 [Mycolicibacterium phlei RIVM601174]|uniref:Glycoside hydrolase n=1 Tax=Mycolicibacterium phlei DSM 43239 = CCUG 21000 TaxID=1226750 RepID=A0A5N5UV99_MYCPH|nr:hypothetical protein MPHLEI_15026 [Mycolicibacterium phlei RIVM601174]KAB7752060.1 glycoside hydrolase [Mycolicibacterium phlei DSM 43239 = CCUG 21000]KXW60658.1 glycoside hydrolase [Mycolicibacterium phlei DSM 43239 = CCUG 21000]MBF4191377.1 hypothetical protein [Mycolicibacterium phlei]
MLALAGSIVLSAGLFYAQAAQPPAPKPAEAPATEAAPEVASPDDVAAVLEQPPVMSAPALTEAELMAASAQVNPGNTGAFALPPGVAPENGLQRNTIRVARALSILFPEIKTIGGYRQDPLKWHPNGLAIDVMIPNHNTEEGIKLGNQIAGYALANGKRWGVIHVIWRQGFYPVSEAPSWTADYGNETANHFDHVHIATDGGGYPDPGEQFYM